MAGPAAPVKSELSFMQQLKLFNGIYWIANWMELVERFAYYGVRVVLPVFMVATFADGGPEFTHLQKGSVFAIWALVQSFVPIFSGGFADRYGYKVNIAISTVLKIIGYLLMGYCIPLAESFAGMSLAEARAAGGDLTYEVFFAGAMLLAAGTAVFKPGVQGLIANQMPTQASSLGWGLFYQCVNIGGFVGPLLAGYLRILDWEYVFLLCAFGIALNFIPLFFFKEPANQHGSADGPGKVLRDAVLGLLEPRLFFFTIAFAGFWLMFYQLFDILPNFIDDWVDSRAAATALASVFGSGAVPTVNEGNLTQEWMINFNALLISIFAFSVGYVTGRIRSLTAIVVGIAISAAAIYALGMSASGWWCLGAIALFSLGEMMASPTKMRYLASIAPPGKDGQYMGYSNFTVGIGWSVGSIVAGTLYQESGDKSVLARRYMEQHLNMNPEAVAEISNSDLLQRFYELTSTDAWSARELLWNTYEPYGMWLVFTLIGVASMVGIIGYTFLVRAANRDPHHSFNTKGLIYVRALLVPIVAAFGYASYVQPSGAVIVQCVLFALLTLVAFVIPVERYRIDPATAPEREAA